MNVFRLHIVSVALSAVVAMMSMVACGGTSSAVKAPVVKAPVVKAPLADFDGPTVAPGEVFRVHLAPVGVKGLGLIARLGKVAWSEYEEGGKVTREATATLHFERNGEKKRLRMGELQSLTVLGCQVTVKGAGEAYVESKARYLPYVDLVATALP